MKKKELTTEQSEAVKGSQSGHFILTDITMK